MSSQAQIDANRANAQHSTGPRTEEGKAAVSQNNLYHGLRGVFRVLPFENQEEYDLQFEYLCVQYQPQTMHEVELVEKMSQHLWMSKRALILQESCFDLETGHIANEKKMALYLRYHSMHDRAFHRCADAFRKIRKERMQQAIGFERHNCIEAAETRKVAAENRKQELHQFAVLLADAKLEHQKVLTSVVQDPVISAKTANREVLKAQKAA